MQWRDVWTGAAVTSLTFSVGRFLIGLYIGKSEVASGFGAAGSRQQVQVEQAQAGDFARLEQVARDRGQQARQVVAKVGDRESDLDFRAMEQPSCGRRSTKALGKVGARTGGKASMRTTRTTRTLVAPLGFSPWPNKLAIWVAPHLSRRPDTVRLVDWLTDELRSIER